MQSHENPQLQLAFDFIHYTNQNIFLTGKAGTGKTTFLKKLKKNSPKRMVVVAPTGVAAINAGGVTIHSFFQLSFGPQIPENKTNYGTPSVQQGSLNQKRTNRFSKNKINLIRSLDLLVIDEISMVRADILDAIDTVLRRFKYRDKPFGGIQLLMIGDLQQLAPVVKEDDWCILKQYYDTCYFFSCLALRKSEFMSIELKHIYRQSEQAFIKILNKIRDNKIDDEVMNLLNDRYIPGFIPGDDEGYITLTTHNYQARQINERRLKKLPGKLYRFKCKVEGDFPPQSYPADAMLEIKSGAQVMFLKNDTSFERRYYNGKIGKVTDINDKTIEVLCPGDTEPIIVEQDIWENIKYRLNEDSSEIQEEMAGKFIQYPLKLAWAITIHKSQGLTFEKAIIDARQSFAHGQVYVALSRCKNFNGLVLSTPLDTRSVINDNTVAGFTKKVEDEEPGKAELEKYRKEYELELLDELFDYKPLMGYVTYLLKTWNGYSASLMGNIYKELQKMLVPVQKEMINVAEKFRPEVVKLSIEYGHADQNSMLQTRLKKAAAYFLEKQKERITDLMENIYFETDNKMLRKRLKDTLTKVETELNVKNSCLESISAGFSIENFLNARALASVEKPSYKISSRALGLNVKNPDFFEQILKWRHQRSIETGLEESRILRQKVMVEISAKLPSTAIDLKSVKGMGGKKMEQFGQDILAMILDYRNKKGMDIPFNARQEVAIAGLDTKEMSLALFKQGLKPQQIAKKRELAVSTVEGHLTHFVSRGVIDIFEIIDRQKYKMIAKHLKKQKKSETLSDIKNKLGESFSYGEIKLVIADMNR